MKKSFLLLPILALVVVPAEIICQNEFGGSLFTGVVHVAAHLISTTPIHTEVLADGIVKVVDCKASVQMPDGSIVRDLWCTFFPDPNPGDVVYVGAFVGMVSGKIRSPFSVTNIKPE